MDKKKKMIIIGVAAAAVIAAVLVLCLVCFHSWQDATCEAPKTCEKCGKTEKPWGMSGSRRPARNRSTVCIAARPKVLSSRTSGKRQAA